MLAELVAAVTFLGTHLPPTTSPENRSTFQSTLQQHMQRKFLQHWDSAHPSKGNGFRAISFSGNRPDPLVIAAGATIGMAEAEFARIFPEDLVVWVDPGSVSYRNGDRGPAVSIWERTNATTPTTTTAAPQKKGYPTKAATGAMRGQAILVS
ncbi:uncharacterized protein EV422DRAFT_521575 [Fimicolochytrium jonesii]|uniref:uncharacterized protein n=1 Tax=Fimicolochytrium jonesii TaxID=1396493 RepID=UPI0022FEA933|nr:uncharacterized protein EV422DRAFT_521575 [Fimicolochytrium jonesii]KAI8823589.1 hypothetical protein EV422DRAFT_521575 [Fimicolochytrium jonesii]